MDHEAPNHPMTSVLKGLIAVGVCLGAILTGLGWLAHWWLALDLVNNGLPATAAGAVLLVCLGAITRDWRLIVASALLATINVALVVSAPQGAAADAAPGSERFLRIATFNLWAGNERMDNVAKFLGDSDADAVVLQEMTTEHWSTLHQTLGEDGADAFHHPAPEVFLNALRSGGSHGPQRRGLELEAVLFVAEPGALRGNPFPGAH